MTNSKWMIAIGAVALLLAMGLGAVIGYNAGECPPPDYSVRDSLDRALFALRADSALLARESQQLAKERNDALARLQTISALMRKQMGRSHSLGADSIMLGLLAAPPNDFDTFGGSPVEVHPSR